MVTEQAKRGTAAPAHERVVVIGAGVGGLCAAMELAARGLDVTVCERAAQPGGKLRELRVDGVAVDAGPTVFTMRWVFEELFARCGLAWPDELSLTPLQLLARHAWVQGGRLDLHADPARTAEAVGALSGAAEARRFFEFTRRAQAVYQSLESAYLRAARPTPVSVAGKAGLQGVAGLARLAPYSNLWRALGRYFHDPRLRQLFARYATYVGSSPFQAPATLMLVAHVEREGVWRIDRGMYALARALAGAACELGAQIRLGEGVGGVLTRGGSVAGVRLDSGEELPAQAVVCNADVSALATGRLGEAVRGAAPATPPERRSLSALTWALRARSEGFPLAHHNVFFSEDYAAEFRDLFERRRLPSQPTVYVCAQDRGPGAAGDPASDAGERLLCLVNAPPTGDAAAPDAEAIAACEQRSFRVLEQCGLTLRRREEASLVTGPADFERLFPASGGALYGEASHGWKSSFTRPGARSRVPGLYLAGGSVHPGAGVPMAALSGHHAAACLLHDRGLR